MAGFTEWSNNRKKELGTSTATTQSSKAKSFTEWSNEKNNITTPQTYRNHNTAFESSGKSRDEYDSSVRQNYAARAAASEPALKTSGGYYSQPTIGADLERYGNTVSTYESALQDKVKKLETANDELERLNGELTVAGAKMESLHAYTQNSTIATGLFNQAQQDYLDLLGQYEEATKAAEAAYNEYQPAYQKYTEAVNAYETYRTEQQGIYDSWRGTIRDADAITQEMASVDAQIEQLEQQQKELNAEATQLMNKVSQRRVGYNEMAGISQQAQEKRQQANALQAEIDALGEMKTLLAEEKDWAEYFSWEDYRSAEDFADRSKYVSTYQPGTEEFNEWSGTYTNTGFGDINYDYINRNETALGRQNVNDTSLNLSFLGLDDSERQQMTDEEIALFNYLYALDTERGDTEHTTAYAYIDYLTSDLNYRQRKEEEEYWANYAKESPVGSSVFSVITSPLKGLSYLGQFADYAEDGEIDQNEGYNKFSYMNTAIRNEVSDTIEKSGNWGSVGSFAYNTGMSMADFLFNTAITGGFAGGGSISSAMALGIMGTGAAADTVISAKDRGLDDGQAFALGTIAGAAEILTEKFSMDALLKGKWEESAIKYILKNAVTEGSEEVGADVINLMADILIAKEQSQWQAAIDAYVAQGKTENEAFGLALADQAAQMGLDFLGGALSGGTIGGTYAGIGTLSQNAAYKQTGASLRKMGDEMLQAIIDTGLQAEENTEAHKMALELQEKMKSGTVTDAEIGRLFSLAAKEANAENATTTPEEGIVLPEAGQETAQQTEQENIGEPLEAVLPTGELQETAEEPARAELPAQEQSELMRTAAMYGIERETVERVQRIADIVHRNIVFYDSAREGENGYRDRATNTLYINARSQNPVAQIISHELTHSLEETGSYADFQTLVLNRIQQTTGDLEQRRRNKAELYASKGVQLETKAEIDQEIVAEYVERNLLTDEASIRAIVQQNRSVGQRIMRWLNDLIAKLGNKDAQQRAFLTRARDLYATALQESQSSFTAETAQTEAPQQAELPVIRAEETATGAGETVIRSGETVTEDGESVVDPADTESDQYLIALREQLANGEITEQEYDRLFDEYYEGGSENQYSFGGRNANTADLDALRRAQEMERQGVAAETIFRETGWYTGADGKWRFEIDDSGMEYNPRREEDGAAPGQTLADFLKHDELFRSYPQLRKTRLEFADLGRGINGQYNAETDTITLSNELRDAPEGTLIHEIQHAIQKAEGFASGANTKFWERQLESGYDGRTQQQRREVQRLWQEYNSIRDNEPDFFAAMVGLEAMAPDVPRGEINWDTLEKIEEDPIEWQRYDAAREKLEQQYGDLKVWDFTDLRYKLKQAEMNAGRSAADLYYDTAGEIEARDTARRRTMTAEERRTTMPNTGNEDTVFTETAEDEWDGEALDTQEDASYNEQTETAEGGVNYGRENGDDIHRRVSAPVRGEQGAEGTGRHRKAEAGVSAERRTTGDAGQDVLREDSEGRRLTDEEAARLEGTAVVDEDGHPIAVYHFTPEMDFETFERGDIGFHFGTEEQARKRGIDLKAASGRMFRAHLNIRNPYRVRLDLNSWWPSHIGLYLWAEGVITDEQWSEIQKLDGRGYNTPGAQRLREMLEGKGIDGFVYPNGVEGDGDSYIALRDEQIVKNEILPVKEQFSFTEPVETTKSLIAWHNMSVESLESALELGGLAMPSFAVKPSDMGHDSYGDCSIIARKESIDPRASKDQKIYGGDAWTPVFPDVSYKPSAAAIDRIKNTVDELVGGTDIRRQLSHIGFDTDNVRDALTRNAGNITRAFGNDRALRYAYLRATGDEVALPMKEENIGQKSGHSAEIIQRIADEYGLERLRDIRMNGSTVFREDSGIANRMLEIINEYYSETFGESGLFTEMQFSDFDRITADAYRYAREGAKQTVDTNALQTMLNERVDEEGYEAWLRELFDGVVEKKGIRNDKDMFTPSGNRRSWEALHADFTLANIVKEMQKQAKQGRSQFMSGANSVKGAALKAYEDIEDVRADTDRLRHTREDAEERYEEFTDKCTEICSRMLETVKSDYVGMFEMSEALAETLAKAKTRDSIKRYMEREFGAYYNIYDGIADDVYELYQIANRLPMEYFESKLYRAYPLDEAAAIVVPDNTKPELIASLRGAGATVETYEAGNEEDRLRVVNSINGAQFSISEQEYNRTAVLTEATIDRYLRDYASKSSPNYAQAYITTMTPEQFLNLTTSIEGRYYIEAESRTLDAEELGETNRQQPIFLRINHETGEVEGHEGRHRAAALAEAGVRNIPVLLFDSSNKSSKTEIPQLQLHGQDFGSSRSYATETARDIIPLSYANRDTIVERFTTQPSAERMAEKYGLRQTLRYSIGGRTGAQKQEVLANLRRYMNGEMSTRDIRNYIDGLDDAGYNQPINLQTYEQSEAQEIVDAAHGQNMSVQEYLNYNWEQFERDGRMNAAAREALQLERQQSRRQYSLDGGTRSTLPVNAQQYLRRAERALLDKVSAALSVPAFARREYLQDIVREISDEYLASGTVQQETIDRLFETAYDEGIVVDDEYYREYKHIKDHLRTQAVTISEQDKHNIADFNDFRKSAFGSLRIVNDGGLPVDVAYQELQGMAGELFPEDITHPADQLVRMFEVARSIEKVEKSLSEYYGRDAAEFKRWAKNDFDTAVHETMGELKNVRRYAEERTQTETQQQLTTQEDVAEAYKLLKEARRTYEKAAAKNLLTDRDNVQVGRLLKGEIELEHLDPAKDNIKGITAVYEAKKEYERLTKLIKEWNNSRKAQLREQADEYLQTANDWKDKKAGILYSRETMERNILDIVKDKKLAKDIIGEYFTPVHEAQAKATKLKNKYRERVKELNLSTKETRAMQKRGQVSEAHAVQLIGEAMDNIRMLENSRGRMEQRDGKTLSDWRGIVQDLWAQNPQLDKAKIEHAIEEFRKIYDELFQMMNDSRLRNGYEPVNYRKGYFPHFQPGDGDGIMGLFGRALGISTDVAALPTTINGLTHTFKPGIQWFGNAQERLGFNTAYDAVEGFDKYIEGVADVIYQTDNIQRLRALATQTRYRTGEEGIRKQVDAVYADPTLSEQDKQNRIEKIFESGRYALSNFVVELEEYTNLLANKKSRADRNMEQALGRDMYNLVKALESRVAANMVAVNPASWLTNFIPLTQGGAQLNRGELLRGMWQTLRAYKESDGIVDASTFLTNRRGSDPLVRTWAQKASAKMSSPMEFIDQFTADSLVRARYHQNLKQGLSEAEAMSEADSWVAGVMADRSKGSTPTLFKRSNPLTKVFTQFQLEVNNQLSYLFKDMPRDQKDRGLAALAAALIKFFLGAWLYDEVYEYFIGRRPALDPIGILNDTVGDITGYELPNLVELGMGAVTGDMPSFRTEKQNAYDTVTNLLTTAAEELPFIGGILGGGRVPISSALPDWDNLLKTVTSDTWSTKKKLATAGKELLNPASYLLLPFGGGQLKKIYQGLDAVIKGGSYSVDAEGNDLLQYPVFNDNPWDTAVAAGQAMLFGKTSLETGRDWIESGFKTFGAKETAAYQAMTDAGVPDEDAYDLLLTLRGAKKTETESEAAQERRLLQEADISGDGKSVVYYGLMASDKERELMDAMTDMDADMGTVTQVLMDVKNAGDLTGAAASNAKRTALAESALTDTEKQTMYRYLFGTKQEDGTYTTSRDDDIMAFEQAGLDMDTFLQVQNEYSSINEEYGGAGEKATEFSRWVNSQDFTPEQAEVVKDCFTYYSQIPVEAARYEKFVATGLEDDTAYELANTINALEPMDGKDSVTDEQKWRAVVDSGMAADEQLAALEAVSTESQYRKFSVAYDFGVMPDAYVTARETMPKFDADGNGSYKNDEITADINSLGTSDGGLVLPGGDSISLTNDQKAALWQLLTGSTSAKNNPYSTSVGWAVIDAVNAMKEGNTGIVLPDGTNYTGGIVLPEA